ncbi:unnamed protein product [Schistosoma margrebowiei]|uniref:Microtubule-associated protein n=1 Tax=Schistosoma margrebowiei TaxID=48269 RepID=A0A183LRC1_9TREM|nr:unnamed protein product [Schistosoma margrebowiei]
MLFQDWPVLTPEIPVEKLDFKEKASPKVGSLANVKHNPAGGDVKIFNEHLPWLKYNKPNLPDSEKDRINKRSNNHSLNGTSVNDLMNTSIFISTEENTYFKLYIIIIHSFQFIIISSSSGSITTTTPTITVTTTTPTITVTTTTTTTITTTTPSITIATTTTTTITTRTITITTTNNNNNNNK